MKQKTRIDEVIGILFLAVSFILLGVSVFLCFSSDIWYDELFTMGLANQSCGRLISITARDVHPPLYYLIVKLFLTVFGANAENARQIAIGQQVAIAKLVSVLPFFLCLLYAGTKVRKHFGMLAAGLFGFLLISMPQMADYTVEIRMYSYALFFVTAGMLHAYELACGEETRKKSYVNWIGLTLYALAACYTHYFACVAACMVYLYLFLAFWREGRLRQEIKRFFCSGIFCVTGYLPWLVSAAAGQIGQVKENYWIQPLSWRTLGGCVKFLFMPLFSSQVLKVTMAVLLAVCYGTVSVLSIVKQMGKGEKEEKKKTFFAAGCAGVLVGIVLFGFTASFLIRPIFVYRYMLPAMGVFWLAFAILFSGFKDRKYFFIPLLIFLVIIGVGNYRSFYGEEMWKRVQMKEAEEALLEIKQDESVIFNFDQTQAVVSYYIPNQTYLWYGEPEVLIREMYSANHSLTEGEFSDEKGILAMKKLLEEEPGLWFLGSGNARDEIIEKWEKAGMEVKERGSVMVERYWFNLYKIFWKNNEQGN